MNLYVIFLLICMFLFVYNYFIYPVIIILFSKSKKNLHLIFELEENEVPFVSLIIAAYNEEKVIEAKIQNSLKLDYPEKLFELIVVSDGSDDSTPEIVKKYSDQGVVNLHSPERKGKSAALNRAAEHARGDILVFSDANNDFSDDAIKHLVKHFNDEKVGAVTGAKKIYQNNSREASKGDGLYWNYESAIKKAESHLGSITAAEGEILAVRKSTFKSIDPTLINDDAAITFNIVKSGYRVLYEANAIAYEQASIDLVDDINVKIRMTSGGFQTISREKKFLFPPRSWFAFSFISHKVLRWLAPHLLILIFFLSIISLDNTLVKGFLFLQILFYLISIYGWFIRKAYLPGWVYIPMYFSVMNVALFLGFIRYFNKSQGVNWTKAKR